MAEEIERKFLVVGDGWRSLAKGSALLRQGYLSANSKATVRVRTWDDARAAITLKGAVSGMTRAEFEYEIPVDDALAPLRERIDELDARDVLQITALAGCEIVHDPDAVAAADQLFGQVGTNETGPAGHEIRRHSVEVQCKRHARRPAAAATGAAAGRRPPAYGW